MAKTTLHMDYYPGGSIMPGRSFSSNSYRFGYNAGSEKDDEIFGTTGSAYHTYFRELDTRINRWWGIDPKTYLTPWESPYASMGNNPIWYNDPLGDLRDNYKLLANGEITKTEDTKDNFDVLYNENESAGIQLDKGILKNKRTGNAEKGSYDIYQIRGDNQGLEFFKFVSMFSKVEWSLFQTGEKGDKGLNFMTTSKKHGTEFGATHLFNYRLISYTIREQIHNHPENSDHPSGDRDSEDGSQKAGEWGDVGWAGAVSRNLYLYQKIHNRPILKVPDFKIFLPKTRETINYDYNTRYIENE